MRDPWHWELGGAVAAKAAQSPPEQGIQPFGGGYSIAPWKTMDGKSLQASPIPSASFRCCPAIPALRQPPIPAPAHVTRPLVLDHQGDDHVLVEEKTKRFVYSEKKLFPCLTYPMLGGFVRRAQFQGQAAASHFPCCSLNP